MKPAQESSLSEGQSFGIADEDIRRSRRVIDVEIISTGRGSAR